MEKLPSWPTRKLFFSALHIETFFYAAAYDTE